MEITLPRQIAPVQAGPVGTVVMVVEPELALMVQKAGYLANLQILLPERHRWLMGIFISF